jgi:ribosomal protein L11 methyltransferase
MIVTSPRIVPSCLPESIIIKINSGASFGMGDHPSTRTALRGVEYALPEALRSNSGRPIAVLDIGTGSGILAIAAVLLGAATAVGLDLDPVARHEARLNSRLNHLDDVITIRGDDPDLLPNGAFDVLIANLRTPTLKQMIPVFRRASRCVAHWVFAGVRDAEIEGLIDAVAGEKGGRLWQSSECGWSGLVFKLEKQRPLRLER